MQGWLFRSSDLVGQRVNLVMGLIDMQTRKYFSLNDLDRKLQAYIDYDNGYYIELGANDGLTQSNTAYFEFERCWSGVLVEPILHNFLKCRVNRPNSHVYCNACVSFEYEKPYVELTYSNLMTAPAGLESDIPNARQHAVGGARHLRGGEVPVDVMAPAKTLNSILLSAKAPLEIDLLSLDVEGAELEVLKGIDFRSFRIKHVLVETRNVQRLDLFLGGRGFYLADQLSFHDYFFIIK